MEEVFATIVTAACMIAIFPLAAAGLWIIFFGLVDAEEDAR